MGVFVKMANNQPACICTCNLVKEIRSIVIRDAIIDGCIKKFKSCIILKNKDIL